MILEKVTLIMRGKFAIHYVTFLFDSYLEIALNFVDLVILNFSRNLIQI